LKASEKIASESGVDRATIHRDAKFAAAVDTIEANVGSQAKAEVLAGKSGMSKKAVGCSALLACC
jgi:transcriptional regulator GlxA family with amidase domain